MYLFKKLNKYTTTFTDPKLVYPNKREDIIAYKANGISVYAKMILRSDSVHGVNAL